MNNNKYYFSIIYSLFIFIFFGTYEEDLLNEAKSGDIVQNLANIDLVRNLDFYQSILLFFPTIIWGIFLKLLTVIFSDDIFIINAIFNYFILFSF